MTELKTHSRKGRESQRYLLKDDVQHRLVVGALPYISPNESCPLPQILLVNGAKHPNEWLIPKGGWENDETEEQCALREAWEESGCVGVLKRELSRGNLVVGGKENQIHTYFALEIASLEEVWPEKDKRGRQLFTLAEAREQLQRQERRKDRLIQLEVLDSFAKTYGTN